MYTMDKRGTVQGIIKVQKKDERKKFSNRELKSESCENFEIDRSEFPSLNEISDRIVNHGKNPLNSSKCFSYSEKLKRVPVESGPCLKFEAVNNVPKNSSAFSKEISSVKSKTPFKTNVPRSLAGKSGSTDSDIGNFGRKILLADPQTSSRVTNDRHPLNVRNELLSSENCQRSNSKAHKNANFALPTKINQVPHSHSFASKTGSHRKVESFHYAGSSTSQTKSDASAPSFQNNLCRNERNISKVQNIDKEDNTEQIYVHSAEVKKKKKRKSKIKRHAALQTGKISVLTPEAHSRIINQSCATSSKQNKNVVVNINDSEEYPELGTTSVPKTNKENSARKIEPTTKDASVSDKNELEAVKLESDLVVSQPISVINETLEAVVKGETNVKPSASEKAPVLIKDPITVSLFDMLSTAKSRKKESEKKNESVIQESPLKCIKPLTKVLGKKEVSNAVNPLDSSRPAVKRGKEREKPKMKKPSRMRKLILMGRQLKKEEMTIFDEKTDVVYTSHSDDKHFSSKLVDSVKDSFNQNLTCHNEEMWLSENDDFDCKASSEENSRISILNEECQGAPMKQMKSRNVQNLSNDCETETFLASNAKSSHILSSNESEKELNKIESNTKIPLHSAYKFDSSEDPSHLKDLSGMISLRTSSVNYNVKSEELKCTLEDVLVYNEDQDFEIRKNKSSTYVEDKCSFNSQANQANSRTFNNCNLSTYQSFSEDNNLSTYQSFSEDKNLSIYQSFSEDEDESSKLKENPGVNILNAVDSECITDHSIVEVSSPSTLSLNDNGNSSCVTNSFKSEDPLNSREWEEKGENSLMSGLNENASCFNFSKQVVCDALGSVISDEERAEAVKTMIHSRKFRKYCNHFISKEIDKVVFALLDDLARFQDRMHQKDPVKARVRKRLLYGIKEIKRHMKLKKLKGIILATDIEDIKTEGGLNDVVNEIISLAEAYHIPYIFSHRRFNLGKVCRKGVAVSCVGIFNYEGSEKNFKRILELQEESKHDYLAVTEALDSVLSSSQVTDVLRLGKGAPEKLNEIRAKILREHFRPDTNQSECEINKPPEASISTTDNDFSKANIFEMLTGTGTSEPKEINKNRISNILTKYCIL